MCQTNAAAAIRAFYSLLWYCCTCIALRVLRSLSHCLQLIRHSSRQLLCPSRHFVHYFLRSASLHLVRSYAYCFKAWHPDLNTKASHSGNAHTFSQIHPTILTGFHCASLRHSFTSVAFSPPAAHNLARRPPHFGCVHLAIANCSFVPHFAKHR